MFAILSNLFRNYIQALLLLLIVPFGIIGALIGYIVMGFSLSIISLSGMIALCGLVINGGIVFTFTANKLLTQNNSPVGASFQSATRKFRPIILTALTTFFGLAPMILSNQFRHVFWYQWLYRLCYGVLFSTLIVLVFSPCLYVIAHDI
ncbi:MAG: efflux RND transporter permease subunit [Desulfobulbaceae bacterium]|nr:MAG: efflux RND transporter permease subunit [Desulfobulbaceae bacterium]